MSVVSESVSVLTASFIFSIGVGDGAVPGSQVWSNETPELLFCRNSRRFPAIAGALDESLRGVTL